MTVIESSRAACAPAEPASDAAFVLTFVAAIVADGETVMLDSYKIADAVAARRVARGGNVDWTQTKDYVQHVLREADHVCRHADGHHYRVHPDPVCGDDCDAKWQQRQAAAPRGHSNCCFLELTTVGVCPNGCDD